jgi:aspartyl protease family protein
MPSPGRRAAAVLMTLAATGVAMLPVPAQAQTPGAPDGAARAPQIQLGGVMGSRALFVIDGQSQMIAVGESARGVRLLSLSGDTARVEHQGKTLDLRVGGSPLVLGAGAGVAGGGQGGNTREIVIPVGQGGHYLVNGTINGHTVRFMVDTGATTIAMGRADAIRIGLDPRKGQLGYANTANGVAPMLSITLDSVRIGEVELYNIAASVTQTDMPYVLLGNSFLSRFQIQHNNEVMRLNRRY